MDGATCSIGTTVRQLLLRGWWLPDVSFYTTELPEYLPVNWCAG
jgi:hypothetical protein